MRVRLQIQAGSNSPATFEHPGPVIRIGRNPALELALDDEAGRSVSWSHARIELSADGGVLTDLQSSNGTLLNDRRIESPQRLRKGDRIQLGFTGPTLTVEELDTVAAEPSRSRGAWVGGGVAIGITVILVAVAAYLFRGKNREVAQGPEDGGTPRTTETRSVAPSTVTDTKRPRGPAPESTPGGESVAKPPLNDELDLYTKQKPVGRLAAFVKAPSLVLQRQRDTEPWSRLRPGDQVYSASPLVCLPGYRGSVALDSGVELLLWGNLPEFDGSRPPVLECRAMLHAPVDPLDLDVTLERGRVRISNAKTNGPARIRLRFQGEIWDLTLPDRASECCAELRTSPPRSPSERGASWLGMFTKGRVRLRAAGKDWELPELSRVVWGSSPRAMLPPEKIPSLPEWWTNQLDPTRTSEEVQDICLALLDWSQWLDHSEDAVNTIVNRLKERVEPEDTPTAQVIGTLFLGALETIIPLVDQLDGSPCPQVRGTAFWMLQRWLSRGGDNRAALEQELRKKGLAKATVAVVVRLLGEFTPAEWQRPETYQTLIDYLDHESALVRVLAYRQFDVQFAGVSKQVAYDPLGDAAQRRNAVAKWKRLPPPEKIPDRP